MRTLRSLTLALATGAFLAGAFQLATPVTAVADDDCEARCRNYAQTEYRKCVRTHGDRERCSAHARRVYHRCVREHCQ